MKIRRHKDAILFFCDCGRCLGVITAESHKRAEKIAQAMKEAARKRPKWKKEILKILAKKENEDKSIK